MCCLSLLCCCAVRYMLSRAKSPDVGGLGLILFGTNPRMLDAGDRRTSRDGEEGASGESINMLSAPSSDAAMLGWLAAAHGQSGVWRSGAASKECRGGGERG
jgi:hypothetical protein